MNVFQERGGAGLHAAALAIHTLFYMPANIAFFPILRYDGRALNKKGELPNARI